MKNIFKITLLSLIGLSMITGCGNSKKVENTDNKTDIDKLKSEISEDGTLKENVNTNKGVIKEQTIEGITLTKINFVSTAYTTTITILAKNNTSNDITLKYFEVYLKDKNGNNVIGDNEFAVASVLGTIPSGGEKTLTVNIDKNLKDVSTIEYKMVK